MLTLLFFVQLALADVVTPPDLEREPPATTPTPEPAATPPLETSPTTTPCDEGVEVAIAALRAAGAREAYECLAASEEAQGALILAMADAGAEKPERVSRALALWRLHRLDQKIPPEEARALLPVDRRLVADGIRAFRGRKTPSEAHALVLEQLDWYKPTPQYIDARLTEQDLANLAVVNDPPKPAPPASPKGAASAMPAEIPPPQPASSGGCGCATGGGPLPSPALLLGLIALARRRRSVC